jgi:hypothetical protein
MSRLLKGNYTLPKASGVQGKKKGSEEKETTTHEFERRAMDRLGGSIAFVIKKDVFLWDGDGKGGGKKGKK